MKSFLVVLKSLFQQLDRNFSMKVFYIKKNVKKTLEKVKKGSKI